MIILSIKTSDPVAEIGMWDDNKKLEVFTWQADRQLADTIHTQIEALLKRQNLSWQKIQGIVVFKGPGSFTGLRIGVTVANALALGLDVPVVAELGKDWQTKAIKRIQTGENEKVALPHYGADAHITLPKK